jgi:hypothetical protein
LSQVLDRGAQAVACGGAVPCASQLVVGAEAAATTCDSKILKVGYTAATTRESAMARHLAERQRTAPQAYPSTERDFWGSANVGVHTNEHRLFDSAEHSTGRAPAGNGAGQAPQNNNAMRLLSEWREASHAHRWIFEYEKMMRRFMNIAEC